MIGLTLGDLPSCAACGRRPGRFPAMRGPPVGEFSREPSWIPMVGCPAVGECPNAQQSASAEAWIASGGDLRDGAS